MISIIAFCFFSISAQAEDVQVHVLKPGVSTKEFEKPGFKIHQASTKGSALPFERARREEWLERAGLKESTQKWDELDRDLIVVRSRTIDEARFFSMYEPKKLSHDSLKSLRKITAKEGQW